MKKFLLVSTILLTISIIFTLSTSFATVDLANLGNTIENTVEDARNTVMDSAEKAGSSARNVVDTTTDAAGNVMDSTREGAQNMTDSNRENNDNVMGTSRDNTNYNATRTATNNTNDDGRILGITRTGWIWIITGTLAVAVAAVLIFYGNRITNSNNHNS